MATGDGLLLRLALADRALTSTQLAGLARAAARFGNGLVEITGRGNLQIRGFNADRARCFAHAIEDLEISIRAGVCAGLSPLAGLDATEIADPRRIAADIEAEIDRQGLSAKVAAKTAVLVDGGDRLGLDRLKADIRLRACAADVWLLSVGKYALGAITTRDAAIAVVRILTRLATRGGDARGADLDRDDLSAFAATQAAPVAPQRCAFDPVGFFELGPNDTAIGIVAAFGQTTADALLALARHPVGFFRPGPGGLLLAVAPRAPAALLADAERLGFIVAHDDPRRSMSACPGTDGCASGHIAARSLAAVMAGQSNVPHDMHVSGCEKGCARPTAAAVTIVGTRNGADVVLHGTSRDQPMFQISATDHATLAARIRDAIAA